MKFVSFFVVCLFCRSALAEVYFKITSDKGDEIRIAESSKPSPFVSDGMDCSLEITKITMLGLSYRQIEEQITCSFPNGKIGWSGSCLDSNLNEKLTTTETAARDQAKRRAKITTVPNDPEIHRVLDEHYANLAKTKPMCNPATNCQGITRSGYGTRYFTQQCCKAK